MRHFMVVPKTALRGAAAACTAGVLASSAPSFTCAFTSPFACATRWQGQSRPYGRGRGGGSFSSRPADPSRAAAAPVLNNKTKDGELGFQTRVAMRDDSILLTEIFKHLPPQGAISIKSLFSALDESVQEALCEKHDGLLHFVEQRKQIFTVRPNPADGVLYVVGNPLVAQQYATRDVQLKTMRQLMGLNEEEESGAPQRHRRPGSSFGSRGGGGGGRGGNYNRNQRRDGNSNGSGDGRGEGQDQRRYQGGNNNNNSSNSNDSSGGYRDRGSGSCNERRRPPLSREERGSYRGGDRSNYSNNNSGPPLPRNRNQMGSRTQTFGIRS